MSLSTPPRNKILRVPHLVVFLALCLAFLYLRTFLFPGTPFLPVGDSLLLLNHATRILHGEVPVRDFFIFLMPGTDLLYAACFRLFGLHMALVQGFLIAIGFALTCVIIWIARKILPGYIALLPALCFLVFDLNSALDATHHWYCTFLLLAAMATLMEARTLARITVAGALCGLAAVFTQTQGASGLVAIALYLVFNHRSRNRLAPELACLMLPFIAIVTALLGYFVHQAGAHAVFYDLFYFPAHYLHSGPNTPRAYFLQVPPHRKLGDLTLLFPYLLIHALVPFTYALCAWRLVRDRATLPQPLRDNLLLLNAVGFAMFVTVLTGPTYHRLCTVAPPAFLLATWLLAGNTRAQHATRILFTTLAIFAFIMLPLRMQRHWHARLNLPLGQTAFLDPAERDRFAWLAAQTHPGETFFPSSQIGFALGLLNPAPIEAVFPDESTRPEQVHATIEALEAHQTCFVYLYPESYLSEGTHDHLGPFRQYIATHYQRVRLGSTGEFWQRTTQSNAHPNATQENPCPSISNTSSTPPPTPEWKN